MKICSEQGTHTAGRKVQEWADKDGEHWPFYLPYNPPLLS